MSGGGHDDDEIHEEHEEHANHEAWVIPYADLLTLLMAMFIALFAISSVNVDKAKRLQQGFNNAASKPLAGIFSNGSSKTAVDGVSNGQESAGGTGILSGNKQTSVTTAPHAGAITASASVQAAAKKEQRDFWHLQQKIQQQANAQGVGNEVTYQLEGRGLVVRLVNDNVLFASGQASIEAEGMHVLQVIGGVLRTIDNPLLIEGYTDNQPINTSQYASNWELSTARADTVLRYLVDTVRLGDSRMTAQGYGARNPVASNDTPEGRAQNRRVEIVIESKVIDQILQANNLTNQAVPTTPTTTASSAKPNLGKFVGDLGSKP